MKRIIVWMLALFGCGCAVFADTQKTLEITTRIEPECPTLHQPIFLIVTAHQSIGKLQYQLPTVKDLEIYYEGKSINTLNGKLRFWRKGKAQYWRISIQELISFAENS